MPYLIPINPKRNRSKPTRADQSDMPKALSRPAAARHAAPVSVRVKENDPTLNVRVTGTSELAISGTVSSRGVAPSTLTLTVGNEDVRVRLARGADGPRLATAIERALPDGYAVRRLGTKAGVTRLAIMKEPSAWRGTASPAPKRTHDRFA